MTTLNINGSYDPSYRYQMPPLVLEAGNAGSRVGKRTTIKNLNDVGKALNREPKVIAKFFGKSLSTQVTVDKGGGDVVLNGAFTKIVLQEALQVFIGRFVLCPACGNPETVFVPSSGKKGDLRLNCSACGGNKRVNVDDDLGKAVFNSLK